MFVFIFCCMSSIAFPKHIFKAYDIRGLVEGELSDELFYRIGRAAVRKTGAKCVLVGYDMRPSSIPFTNALIRGVTDEGADVINIGLASTPILNISALRDSSVDLGIMITASHNPESYNGCKLLDTKTLLPIGLDSGLSEIRDMVETEEFGVSERIGTVTSQNVKQAYVDQIFAMADTSQLRPLTVVFDFGNGIEGIVIDDVLVRLPVTPTHLFKEPDGRFPNHEANPIKHETLRDLQRTVLEKKADFGFAFDGDADRVGLVDEKGNIISGDIMMALLVPTMLKKYPGSPVLYDLRSSRVVRETIEACGGIPIESKVGRTIIIQEMRKHSACFAGELSCHFYYTGLSNVESGDLTLLWFLKVLSESGKTMSELVAPLMKYVHSGEINFEVEDKDAMIATIENVYAAKGGHISHLDGVKVDFSDWWFLLRKSNTEPLLRLTLETSSKELTAEKVAEIRQIIEG